MGTALNTLAPNRLLGKKPYNLAIGSGFTWILKKHIFNKQKITLFYYEISIWVCQLIKGVDVKMNLDLGLNQLTGHLMDVNTAKPNLKQRQGGVGEG